MSEINYKSRYQTQIGWLFTFVLALLVAGCGGGGGSSSSGAQSSGASSVQADAGDIIGIRVGETANLDGSASSTTSGSLTYKWSFTHKPQASKTAVLINENSVNPTFIPDVVGTYMVQLVVSAGGISSQRAIALVEASISGNVTGDVRVHTSFPSQCSSCHDGRFIDPNINPGLIPPKSGNHVGASNMCQACHTTFGFNLIRYVDHQEVFGNCSSCHNGIDAIGKSDSHVTTNSECNDCHNTTSFLKLDAFGNYDHTGITSGCATCHNGKTALGINHTPDTFDKSNKDCVFCHNTTTFVGGMPDHSVILADVTAGSDRCDRCHGSTATGPINGHPVISPVDCGSCHSITQFSLGGVYNHRIDANILSCETCHNDNNTINARGKGAAVPAHITTTADCGVCHGVGGGNFASGTLDHLDSTVTVKRCDSCHRTIAPVTKAIGKTVNHIQTQTNDPVTPSIEFTGVDCVACHSPGNFATGTFDHSVANTGSLVCSDCHNGTNTAGKHISHIPTADECGVCHTTTTFIGATVDHSAITNNCASCHDGNISKGKSTNHLDTTRDCVDCHTTTPLTFIGGTFDHVGVTTCASCHDGVIALDKSSKVNHIPAKKECSQCHTDTTVPGGFVNSIFNTDVHPAISTGCEGCHNTKFFPTPTVPVVVKETGHIPTNQDCHSCHTNVKFTPQIFTHAGISGNCESCHDGNYFTSANAMGKAQVPDPANNPHPDTTADCGTCHGIGNNFKDGIFDHTGVVSGCSTCHGDGQPGATTKKHAAHVTTTEDCSVCHVPGTFATAVFNHTGIVDNCASCHDGSVPTATIKSANHIPTKVTEDCSDCHNTTAFLGARYDHTGITTNCASCHDGIIALGKDGNHVPTGEDCSVCHKTTGFIPGTFDHTGIVDNCSSCHDGFLAIGKPATGHVQTNSDCGLCHTPVGFIPATFDHSGVSINTRCDSCHGVISTGKDQKTNPVHWDTSLDCRSCHTTATFIGGTWTHEPSSKGTCDTCHSPTGGARDKITAPGGHMTTTSQCDECHTTAAWAPTNFSHDLNNVNQDDYPGDHNAAFGCVSCHGKSIDNPFVYPTTKYAPFCAACHAGDFDSVDKHFGGSNGTVEQNKDCSNGGRGCHQVGDRNFN